MYESRENEQMYSYKNHETMDNSNPGVPRSKTLCGSKFNSVLYPSEVNQMSTRNYCKLSGLK